MLFNSYLFIFCFLPITLIGFHLIGKKRDRKLTICWLFGASLCFYGWWNAKYVALIIFSILVNFAIGSNIEKKPSKSIFILGIMLNVLLLGYYKYSNFFIDNMNIIMN